MKLCLPGDKGEKMTVFGPEVDVAIISFGLSVVSQVMSRKFANRDEMMDKQKKMKDKQQRINELMKKEDAQSKRELESLQQEMLEDMQTMMQGSMRMMIFSMIVFVPTFWFIGETYQKAVFNLPVPIPWFGENWSVQIYNQTNWMGWYVLCALVFGIVLNAGLNLMKKKGGK